MTATQSYLFDLYGAATLNTHELAKVAGYKDSRSVLEAIRRETFPIPTFKPGKLRLADIRDVAAYLDKCREAAA